MGSSAVGELSSRDPAGFRWELRDDIRRNLIAHLGTEPMFTVVAIDDFVWLANTRLRFYRRRRRNDPPFDPKRLASFARDAEALADAIKKIDTRRSLFNRRVDLQDRAGVMLPEPAELRRIAAVAREFLKHSAVDTVAGNPSEIARLHRDFLIRDLWQHYPEPLRSKALRSHFIETLRILLGRATDASARRALQQEARRALAGMR